MNQQIVSQSLFSDFTVLHFFTDYAVTCERIRDVRIAERFVFYFDPKITVRRGAKNHRLKQSGGPVSEMF
jgi:hypothetical protein